MSFLRPLFTKTYPIKTCNLRDKKIAARVAMAVAAHARSHVRKGEAEERLDGTYRYTWYITPEKK